MVDDSVEEADGINGRYYGDGYNNLLVKQVIESGKHTISYKILDEWNTLCLVPDGYDCNDNPTEAADGYGCFTLAASNLVDKYKLTGNAEGKIEVGEEDTSKIEVGQIVSMQADFDQGSLRIWIDGKLCKYGWHSGVKGKLRWGVSFNNSPESIQIVPNPELEQL